MLRAEKCLQVLGMWQRHIRVPGRGFGRAAEPWKRQMSSGEEKPVARNHVEHFLAVRDRHGWVMVERDRAVRLRKLQSRVVHDVAPDQELITRRRDTHHSVAHGVTGSRHRGDTRREHDAILVHLQLPSVGVWLDRCLGEIEEWPNGLGRLFTNSLPPAEAAKKAGAPAAWQQLGRQAIMPERMR